MCDSQKMSLLEEKQSIKESELLQMHGKGKLTA